MKILLYEHVSSGGYATESIPLSLLCEGYAMLQGLTADFKRAGHAVTVLLDARIAAFHPTILADKIVQISSSGEADQSMESVAETSDAAYIIAPESNQVLQSLVECLETTGTLSLNCQANGIAHASEKGDLERQFESLGLEFPKTESFPISKNPQEIAQEINDELGFPAIVKPAIGAGGGGLSIVQNSGEIDEALNKIRRESAGSDAIAQKLIKGVPASVSLFRAGEVASPLSLNLQDVTIAGPNSPSSYNGGCVPFEHSLRDVAFASAKRLVESIEGLRGYVGVDLVLSEDHVVIIEINPRLTTSYVGLRNVVCFNPAQAILNSVIKEKLPEECCKTVGFSCFSKLVLNKAESLSREQACSIESLLAPPFQMPGQTHSYALVHACDETFEGASSKLDEVKRHIRDLAKGDTSI